MTKPVQYLSVIGEIVDHDQQCPTCGATGKRMVRDHCHDHGWIRGVICSRCNSILGQIDVLIRPSIDSDHLAALVAHANNCHECATLHEIDLLGPLPIHQYEAPIGPARRPRMVRGSCEIFTKQEVADMRRVDIKYVNEWIRSGVLSAIKSGKQVLITRAALDDFADLPQNQPFPFSLKFGRADVARFKSEAAARAGEAVA